MRPQVSIRVFTSFSLFRHFCYGNVSLKHGRNYKKIRNASVDDINRSWRSKNVGFRFAFSSSRASSNLA
ncbi:hypothetical protein KsCSTR_25780 [Candidatus Kuenenia stuttgartiensis]|uniref:Uncharacterized protein n=1 Tax=Kuenenia stuttgartiensis TaxID=174633 RepID=Q1Q742_KUEST|nr:hypothetical protein KsCSTR_25780 [Candidatus Kuenenia stuttgartiensis]CAJ73390.1 unknown protein [Candidatus Kuenenia stuttgartiensis]